MRRRVIAYAMAVTSVVAGLVVGLIGSPRPVLLIPPGLR